MDTIIHGLIYGALFLGIYFQVFLYMTLFQHGARIRMERARAKKELAERTDWPRVSVIVPAYNEERTIGNTIESLLGLNYPKESLEIIVVNDGSKDRTGIVARAYTKDTRVKVIEKENGGKYTALNAGIAVSSGNFIGCLDADSFVDPLALKTIITYFNNKEVMAVCPTIVVHEPKTFLQGIQSAEYLIGALMKKVFSFLNAVYVTPGPFSIYRKEVFDRLGGFRHAYNTEDMEMALRMQTHRMIIETAHDARVFTVAPRNFRELYVQRVRWVSGHLKNSLLSYRFMFFKKRFGHLGVLTLPSTILSILITFFFAGYGIYTSAAMIEEKFVYAANAGIDWSWSPIFDWFFVSSNIMAILMWFTLISTIGIVLLSSRLIDRRFAFTRFALWFMLFYGFIAPLWLLKSAWNFLRTKEVRWR